MQQQATAQGHSPKSFNISAAQAADGFRQMVYGLGFAVGGMLAGLVLSLLINQF